MFNVFLLFPFDHIFSLSVSSGIVIVKVSEVSFPSSLTQDVALLMLLDLKLLRGRFNEIVG